MRSDARSNISIGGWKGDLSFMKGGRKEGSGGLVGGAHVAFTISTREGRRPSSNNHSYIKGEGAVWEETTWPLKVA